MKEHEVTLSMGNGMRAGAIHDATDRAGIQELLINAELADKAHDKNVQVIVEGPGHVPIDEIATNVQLDEAGHEQQAVLHARPDCDRYSTGL